jgi:transposase
LQLTETDDADHPHLITDIAITPAPQHDMPALPEIRARQAQQGTLPRERFVDSGYMSGEHLKDGRVVGEELLGPIRTTVTPQSRLPDGFSYADFLIDFEQREVTCPAGHATLMISSGKNGVQAIFPRKVCATCPLRSRCCTGAKEGRALTFSSHYQETQEARQRQQTEAFKTNYRAHRPGVEGCLSALVRGQGIRTTHYVGQAKNHLRALFVGTAVNLARSAAWRAGYRPKKRPARLGLLLGGGANGTMGVMGSAQAAEWWRIPLSLRAISPKFHLGGVKSRPSGTLKCKAFLAT